jgi:ribosomal protein S18 acetylase RimI-like enzyme
MTKIREAKPDDLEALYHISLKTGHLGKDASHLYSESKMIGHIYSAPYLRYSPALAFVIEIDGVVLGYCVGTSDTQKFEVQLEKEWWPVLRRKYQKPNEKTRSVWSPDERISQMIHEPQTTPEHIYDRFAAHLHLNLLPEIQGCGLGTSLFDTWMQKAVAIGTSTAHIGADYSNERAIRFWEKQGFEKLDDTRYPSNSGIMWMGREAPL